MDNLNKRITEGMNVPEMIMKVSEGNPGAMSCLISLINKNVKNIEALKMFDDMGIYGSKIYMIWNDSCARDLEKFEKTLEMFKSGKFTVEEIQERLSKGYAEPFIEEDEEGGPWSVRIDTGNGLEKKNFATLKRAEEYLKKETNRKEGKTACIVLEKNKENEE